MGHLEKTASIYIDSSGQAAGKLKVIPFNTDPVRFFDGDFICGKADIKDGSGDGCKKMESEGDNFENKDRSDCPYFYPVRGEYIYEGED